MIQKIDLKGQEINILDKENLIEMKKLSGKDINDVKALEKLLNGKV